MKKISLAIILLNIVLCAMAQSTTFGYYTGSELIDTWGTGKAETYSVAMKIDQPALKGTKVTAIKIPVNDKATSANGYTAFLTKELNATSGKATGDICNVEFTPNGQWNTIQLPEPYTIGDDVFYVGYTFTVTTLANFDEDSYPLILVAGVFPGGLNIITSRTYRRWTDATQTIGGSLALQIVLEVDGSKTNIAAPTQLTDKVVKRGEQNSVLATIANHGVNDINTIDYVYEVAGQQASGHVTLDAPITSEFYGNSGTVAINVPAISEKGLFEGKLTILKVNDADNTEPNPSTTNEIRVMNVIPVKRPLMEEFTGTWCGFCPMGYVGMKLMNEWHPGEFICASYHNDDAMQITTRYPVYVDGYPMANFDRHHSSDAFYGDTYEPMGVEKTWKEVCQEYTPVNVDVNATLDATGKVHVDASYTFCDDIDNANYGLAYIVTADGLSGTSKAWRQHSYLNTENGDYYNGYMDDFCNGQPEYQFLVYDDVVVAESGESGAVIKGVIPAQCAEGDVYTHTYSFDIASMNSNYGQKENLVQDKNKLNVIALIYDNRKRAVMNCAKCHVVTDTEADGITSIATSTLSDGIYTLDGKRLSTPAKGINIIRKGSTIKKVVY